MAKQKSISYDDSINKAIQDSKDDVIKSPERTGIASARIDGEIPDISKYIRTFDNIDSFNIDGSLKEEG